MVSRRTSMVNVSVAVSPSSSVAVHVYRVREDTRVGVPVAKCVPESSVKPAGSAGVKA